MAGFDGDEDDFDDDFDFDDDGGEEYSKAPGSASGFIEHDVVLEGKHRPSNARSSVQTPSSKKQPPVVNKDSSTTKKKSPVGAAPPPAPASSTSGKNNNKASNSSKNTAKPAPSGKQLATAMKKAPESENKQSKTQQQQQQQQRIEEEADFEQTLEMFGNRLRIDSMLPKTKRDFDEFGEAISHKVLQFQSNDSYFSFIEKLVKQIVAPLSFEQLNAISISLEAIRAGKTPAQPQLPPQLPPQQPKTDSGLETSTNVTTTTSTTTTSSASSKMDDFAEFKGGLGGKRDEDIYDDFM